MKIVHVLALAVRLFAIGLFVYALNTGVVAAMMSKEVDAFLLVGYVIPIAYILIAVLLWFFPFTVIASLIKGFKIESDEESAYKTSEIIDAMFIVLGLFLLFRVISDGTYWFMLSQYASTGDVPVDLGADRKASIAATVVEAVIALVIIFGRKGIYNFIKKFRSVGS